MTKPGYIWTSRVPPHCWQLQSWSGRAGGDIRRRRRRRQEVVGLDISGLTGASGGVRGDIYSGEISRDTEQAGRKYQLSD